MYLYTVLDSESKTHIAPFAMKTNRDAIEGFRLVANDEKTDYNKFPNDYSLIKIGSFDERQGTLESQAPEKLICAADLISKIRTEQPEGLA